MSTYTKLMLAGFVIESSHRGSEKYHPTLILLLPTPYRDAYLVGMKYTYPKHNLISFGFTLQS